MMLPGRSVDEQLEGQKPNSSTTQALVGEEIISITEKILNLEIDVSLKGPRILVAGDDEKAAQQINEHQNAPPTGPVLLLRNVQNILAFGSVLTTRNEISTTNHDLVDIEQSINTLIADGQHLHVSPPPSHTDSGLDLDDAIPKPGSPGRLPVELWAQIFVMCLPEDLFVKPNPREAPLLLCQVCSEWRRIATGTPLIWSTLSIRGSWRRQIWKSSLECWLQRSGNTPLCLDISIPAYMEPAFDEDVKKLVMSTANRWYHLRLSLPDTLLRSILGSTPMPTLHRLEFNSPCPITALEIHPSQAPGLKAVSLLTKSLYPQPLTLPWNQLTSLSSQCWLNILQHVEILRNCPLLESYGMCVVHHTEIPFDANRLLMEHLHRLEIVTFIGHSMGPILSHLQLPKLARLSFTIPRESPTCGIVGWPSASIISLVERSSCPLETIQLRGIEATEGEIKEMKEHVPSLASVDLL